MTQKADLSPFEGEVIFPFTLLHGNKASIRNRHEHFDPFVLFVLFVPFVEEE